MKVNGLKDLASLVLVVFGLGIFPPVFAADRSLLSLLHEPESLKQIEEIRRYAMAGWYVEPESFSRHQSAFIDSNLYELFSLVQNLELSEQQRCTLLDSIDMYRFPLAQRLEPEANTLYQQNIAFALQTVHRQIFEKCIHHSHYALAARLLELLFKFRVPVFSPQQEAGSNITIPLAAPLLETVAQGMYVSRKALERQLARVQGHLPRGKKEAGEFFAYAREFLPKNPFKTTVIKRVEQGSLGLASVDNPELRAELLRYLNLGVLRNQFLALSGKYYLPELLAEFDLLTISHLVTYLSNKNEEFKDVLMLGGAKALLQMEVSEANIFLKIARFYSLWTLEELSRLAPEGLFFTTKNGDNVLHCIMSRKDGNDEEIADFIQRLLYSKRFDQQVLLEALKQVGAQHETPLQLAAGRGYDRCVKDMIKFLQEEGAYDPLDHGGSTFDLFRVLEEAVQNQTGHLAAKDKSRDDHASAAQRAQVMEQCRPVVPFTAGNPEHQLLQEQVLRQLEFLLQKAIRGYEDPLVLIYQPAFELLYEFYNRNLAHFGLSSPSLQLTYLAAPLAKIVEKISYDCADTRLSGEVLYSYLCSDYEVKLPVKVKEELKKFLIRLAGSK